MLANITNRDCDRYIPNRKNNKQYLQASPSDKDSSSISSYSRLIKKELITDIDTVSVSSFSTQQSLASATFNPKPEKCKLQPNVGSPVKILDIPRYQDDFYYNNIDWSDKGPIGIAL